MHLRQRLHFTVFAALRKIVVLRGKGIEDSSASIATDIRVDQADALAKDLLKLPLNVVRSFSALAEYEYFTIIHTFVLNTLRDLYQLRIWFALGVDAFVMNALKVLQVIENVVPPAVDMMSLATEAKRFKPLDGTALFTTDVVVRFSTACFIGGGIFRLLTKIEIGFAILRQFGPRFVALEGGLNSRLIAAKVPAVIKNVLAILVPV